MVNQDKGTSGRNTDCKLGGSFRKSGSKAYRHAESLEPIVEDLYTNELYEQ